MRRAISNSVSITNRGIAWRGCLTKYQAQNASETIKKRMARHMIGREYGRFGAPASGGHVRNVVGGRRIGTARTGWMADIIVIRYMRFMAAPVSNDNSDRLRTALNFERWEAISHFIGDGDFLAFHQSDYRGAIVEYEKAWDLLETPWQREEAGADILRGIADFAVRSEDPYLASDTLETLLPRIVEFAEFAETALGLECEELMRLADAQQKD